MAHKQQAALNGPHPAVVLLNSLRRHCDLTKPGEHVENGWFAFWTPDRDAAHVTIESPARMTPGEFIATVQELNRYRYQLVKRDPLPECEHFHFRLKFARAESTFEELDEAGNLRIVQMQSAPTSFFQVAA